MKKSIVIISLCILFISLKANGQSKFYLSTEANFIYDLYEVTDEGNDAGPSNIRTLDIPGTTIIGGYQFSPAFSLETGIATRPVKTGYSLRYSKSEGGGLYYHIPVRARVRIPLLGDWLYVTTSLGLQLSVTDPANVGETNSGSSQRSMTRNGEVITSTTAQYYSYNKYFLTAAAEAGLDFQVNPKFDIYSTFSYNKSFTDLERTDVQYTYKNEPMREATVLHQGSYVSVNIGLRYRFGNNK